jgi:bifunctional non-homologous end joining protein LigD
MKFMTTTATLPSVTLYFKQGSSDKMYQCHIEASGEGYLVNFAYGRRGDTLRAGTKTKTPVTLEKADKIYGSLVLSKTSKGYKPGGDTSTYEVVAKEEVGYCPQLLNEIDEDEAMRLINDTAYWAQEKKDGHRMLGLHKKGAVTAGNKRGLRKSISDLISSDMSKLNDNLVLDGESVGDTYYTFDSLFADNVDIQNLPYSQRLAKLEEQCEGCGRSIQVLPTARTSEEKMALFNRVRDAEGEGVVFKRHTASYKSGKPASGGDQFKFKFYATATCRVSNTSREGKRSVGIELLEGGSWFPVGNVAIPANADVPASHALIEVKYLYAFKGGSLFQTVYLGERDDCVESDCRVSQLKYKPDTL